MIFKDYISDICQFFGDRGLKIDPIPRLVLNKDQVDDLDPFIQTGNYNPSTNTITLFVGNRQLKDILRSYCHELAHRNQHIEMGERFENMNKDGKLEENEQLENIEGDAYRLGNLMFRKWTENRKLKIERGN